VTAVAAAPARAAGRLSSAAALAPAALVAAVWIVWGVRDGGYFPSNWYPAGLLAAGLLLTLAIARPRGAFAPSPATLALALLAAWTAWNAVSLLWSDAPGAGREETNKLLTVVVMGAVIAATPWRPRSAFALLGLWAGAIAVVAAVDLTAFALSATPESWVLEGRYLGPTGYANGSAALGAMAFWPLLALSARPATPEPLRVLALPVAVVALLWALLPQSRGTMLAAGLVVALFVALSPHRGRVITRLAIVGGALLLCVPSLFDVYTASREGRALAPVVDDAAIRVAVAAVLALAASFALVGVEQRITPSARAVSLLRRATLVAGVLVVLGGAAMAIASYDRLGDTISTRWETFASDASVENVQTGARLGQVIADKRYDYWNVALDGFREQPIAGIGAAGFEPLYTAQKSYPKHSRYVHLIWLRALSETGVIGLALLVGSLLAAVGALVRARIRGPAELHGAVAAAAALTVAFFLQCGLDWLEEVPALLAPAVCLPLAVLRATTTCTARASALRVAPAAVLAVVALAALTPSYLAVRYLDRGDELRRSNPQAALEPYDRAASADPLSLTPHFRTGFVGLQLGDVALARQGFEDSLDVQENWLAHFELGLLDLQAGRFAAGSRQLARAAELNRNDPMVTDAQTAAADRERLDPVEFNRRILDEAVLALP
jgi:tetratricopeptide (TPR) repeat protein